MMNSIGKYIFLAGIIIACAGLILWLSGNRLNWLGKLPGDIMIKREGFSFYFPITTMILLSVVISLAAWLIRRWNG